MNQQYFCPPGPLSSLMTTVRSYTATVALSPARPSASHPIGVINRGPFDQRPITAMVPLTPRPPLRVPLAPGGSGQVGGCEGRVARGVQWPPTLMGETVERPCPKGSLGRSIYKYDPEEVCAVLQLHACTHIIFPSEMESRVLSLNLLVEEREEQNRQTCCHCAAACSFVSHWSQSSCADYEDKYRQQDFFH